jgi:hypothetical protein
MSFLFENHSEELETDAKTDQQVQGMGCFTGAAAC